MEQINVSTDDPFRITTIPLFYLLCQLAAAFLPEGHRGTCLQCLDDSSMWHVTFLVGQVFPGWRSVWGHAWKHQTATRHQRNLLLPPTGQKGKHQHAQAQANEESIIRSFSLLNVNAVTKNKSVWIRRALHNSIACILEWNITTAETFLASCGKMQLFLSQPAFKLIKSF